MPITVRVALPSIVLNVPSVESLLRGAPFATYTFVPVLTGERCSTRNG